MCPWNAPFSAATVSSRVSYCDERAVVRRARCARRAALRELHREAPELRRERDVRGERLEVLRAERRDVHGVRDEAALERGDDLLGDDHARAILRLLGRRGEVRRRDDVLELEQRARVRLLREDVERRGGDLAGPERLDERVLVDELAARGVDEPDAVAHLRERVGADRLPRLRRQRQVQRHEVGGGVEIVGRLDALDAELAEAVLRDERVVRDDAHLETERATRDLLADASEAEHAERLAGELDAAEARALPAPLRERRVRLRDVAREREQQPTCARPRR